MGKKIIKRDGSIEDFQPQKISDVLTAAGLESSKTTPLVDNINAWAISQVTEEISSLAIRDMVLAELYKVDPQVANLFAWYQKTKDNS